MILLPRLCAAAAALALICVVAAIALSLANQSLRQQVAERQRVINQGSTLSQVNLRLANSLAAVALRDGDDRLKKLLADFGIAMKPDQATPGTAAPK